MNPTARPAFSPHTDYDATIRITGSPDLPRLLLLPIRVNQCKEIVPQRLAIISMDGSPRSDSDLHRRLDIGRPQGAQDYVL
jgi:hypothetical protein